MFYASSKNLIKKNDREIGNYDICNKYWEHCRKLHTWNEHM